MVQKKMITLIAALLVCLSLTSCHKDEKPTEVRLKVTPETVNIQVGDVEQLTVLVKPSDAKYSCESSNPSVASVSETGLVTALAPGETKVKVTAGNASQEVKVSVIKKFDIDKSRYLGLNAPDDERKFFAPIYIPTKETFLPNKVSFFKAAMTPYEWIFKPHEDDPKSLQTYYFASPRKLDKNGKEQPEVPRFCMDAIIYYHSIDGHVPFIHLVANKMYEKDYMIDPSNFSTPQDLDIQETLLKIVKHYGFTEEGRFLKLKNGDNGYQAYNTTFDPQTPLTGLMYTAKEGHGYGLYFQIDYGKITR